MDRCQHPRGQNSSFSLTGKPRYSPNHPGARTWGFSSCMSPSLCHSRQVRSDSALSPYILDPILILLCLDPRGWRSTWQRAKPTGKPSATRAKGNGNNPRGEEWEVSVLSKAGPGVSPKTETSRKVPIFTRSERSLSTYFHSKFIHQNIYAALTVCQAWKHPKRSSEEDEQGPVLRFEFS